MQDSQKLDVVEVIDSSPIGGFQIAIFVLCGLCLMLDGARTAILRKSPDAAAKVNVAVANQRI